MNVTIPFLLQEKARIHPERLAFIFEDEQISYQEYYNKSLQTAAYLQSLGLEKGDRIAILDLNNKEIICLVTGAMLAGVIPVSVGLRAMPPEIMYIAADAGIKHFFYGKTHQMLGMATPFPEEVEVHAIHETEFTSNNEFKPVEITNDDICAILYTSGTTGYPKGVVLNYTNIYNCYYQCYVDTPDSGPNGRNLVCGPLLTIFGFGAFFSAIYAGATNVVIKMFDAAAICKVIPEHKVNNALMVPIMFKLIMAIEGVKEIDFSSMKHIQYGGSPVSGKLLLMASKLFGCKFTQVYGLTETAGVACALRFDDHEKILKDADIFNNKLLLSAGKPGAGIQLKIIMDDNHEAPLNEPGEVYVKGENVAVGYWNKPDDKSFTDGWCKTGDIGYVNEEGYLFLVDRKNDKIVSKGVNIYPAEIENVLEQFPNFREVAVVGVPDEKAGEAICAVAVLKKDATTLEELQAWCKGKMPDHKIPKHLDIKTELPRNPTGKILRRLIQEPYWSKEQRRIKGS